MTDPNYARWGVLFLTKLETAYPKVREVLQKGAFSIQRNSKQFSRTAMNMTLGQTVNRDAASPMKGIVGFQNTPNAIRRWCLTSTQRGVSVTEVRCMTGLLTEEQSQTQQPRTSRINKDNHQGQALLTVVTNYAPPSKTAMTSTHLPNIAIGKAASPSTMEYLTVALRSGHELQGKFREECADHSTRLLKPIKRRKS